MKPKIPRLRVPAAIYDEALRFVNARRKEKKLGPIKALPAGRPKDDESCPCAAKCGAPIVVEGEGFWHWRAGMENQDGPSHFTEYFDDRAPGLTLPVRGLNAKVR